MSLRMRFLSCFPFIKLLNKLCKKMSTKATFFCWLAVSSEGQGNSGCVFVTTFDHIWLRTQKPSATSLLANQAWPGHSATTATWAFKSLAQSLGTVLIWDNYNTPRSFFVEKREITQARTIPNRQFECNHPVLGSWERSAMAMWNVWSQLTLELKTLSDLL